MPLSVDELAADLAIANVVCRLAICSDQGALDDYLAAFDSGATLQLPGLTLQGADHIRELAERRRAEGAGGPGSGSRHVVTNVAVTPRGPEAADAVAYFSYYESTNTAPVLVSTGTYSDSFRRLGGRWRIVHRNVSVS